MTISSDVENLFFQKIGIDVEPTVFANRARIRQRICETAFHEAGHVVARMFTGHNLSHVLSVSIIPDDTTYGRETMERNSDEILFPILPKQAREGLGYTILIWSLAGRAAAFRVAKVGEVEDILDWCSEEWWIEGADLYSADYFSRQMARKYMPRERILRLAEKWTVEMLEIPQVWETTNEVAAALLQQGELESSELFDLCSEIENMSFRLPVWKNRLSGGARARKWWKEQKKTAR